MAERTIRNYISPYLLLSRLEGKVFFNEEKVREFFIIGKSYEEQKDD
jgi:hypothetical protein